MRGGREGRSHPRDERRAYLKWLKNKLGEVTISRALANAQEEALYARAALEVAKGDIRPGLWAKATAAADGDERKAEARYLGLRVEQLQLQLSAAEEMARVGSPVDAERWPVEEKYDALNGKCPNGYCSEVIPLKSQACPKCGAQFGEGAAWRVLPIKTT
jgi:hypothetical protein